MRRTGRAGAASADVLAAVVEEVGHVTRLQLVAAWRYASDGTVEVMGAWSERPHPFQPGTRWPLDRPSICSAVLKTGRPARIDDFSQLPGDVSKREPRM
jgi:GAF domain-containing protein